MPKRFFIRPIKTSEDKKSLNPDGNEKTVFAYNSTLCYSATGLWSANLKFLKKIFGRMAAVCSIFLKGCIHLFKRDDRRVGTVLHTNLHDVMKAYEKLFCEDESL